MKMTYLKSMIKAIVFSIICLFLIGCAESDKPAKTERNFSYGDSGGYAYEIETLTHNGNELSVYLPVSEQLLPVVFFTHGFGADRNSYIEILDHMARRGCVVVFPSFPTNGMGVRQIYDHVFSGFEKAIELFGDRLTLSYVGFVGHSFGGGANPNMAYRGLVERGWGGSGSFIYSIAPWYTYEMTDSQLSSFPGEVVFLEQVYEDDTVNDHRMAIDIYEHISIAQQNKFYQFIHTENSLVADHYVPTSQGSDTIRRVTVMAPFDAIYDSAFNKSNTGFEWLAAPQEVVEDYSPFEVMTNPEARYPEDKYSVVDGLFGGPWSHYLNPRR